MPAPAWTKHVERARAAWPSLAWEVGPYHAWLVEVCGGEDACAARLDTLDAAETVLAWTAAAGDAEALRLFDLHYISQVAPAVRRFGDTGGLADEVAQRVRIKLLVAPPGERAAILRYALGGGLAGLVRVAAIREALSLQRAGKPADPAEQLEQLVGEADPELRVLKARYATELQRAFSAAIAELTARERHLLRLHLSAHASIDDLARMYQTHRATAARWLNAARDRLADATRRHLQATLGLDDHELQSVLRLIRTEAPRMLESIPPDADDPELH